MSATCELPFQLSLGKEGAGLLYSRRVYVQTRHPAAGLGTRKQIASLATAYFQHFVGNVSDSFLYVRDVIVFAAL